VLETLSPDERAVFVLREVFGFDYDDIGSAVRRPTATVRQIAQVSKLVTGLLRTAGSLGRVEPAIYNGAPAMVLRLGDHLECVITLEITDGRITNFYAMRNPDKLAAVSVQRAISR
jgi:RNA polymerase sigma-70 factor, ECF subfamily